MTVNSVKINNFKNIASASLEFHPECNIIVGKNAMGKTNLLEAIWIFTGCRSFRGSKERDYVQFGESRTALELDFSDSRRRQHISYVLLKSGNSKEKKITLNKVNVTSAKKLFDSFRCVVFTPDDIEFVKGSPEKRRSFVDMCISQLNLKALEMVKRLDVLLMQRNAVLKKINSGYGNFDSLEIWDRQLAQVGSWISFFRHKYTEKLSEICSELYSKITGGSEKLFIEYSSNIFDSKYNYPEKEPNIEMSELYYKMLCDSRADDVRTMRTRFGAGRDDLNIFIDEKRVRDFGSQGQKKSTALVLKLAQAKIFSEKSGETPIILLDDVMGELDLGRQRFVYSLIKDMQIFITTCHRESIDEQVSGKVFHVEKGKVLC